MGDVMKNANSDDLSAIVAHYLVSKGDPRCDGSSGWVVISGEPATGAWLVTVGTTARQFRRPAWIAEQAND